MNVFISNCIRRSNLVLKNYSDKKTSPTRLKQLVAMECGDSKTQSSDKIFKLKKLSIIVVIGFLYINNRSVFVCSL